MSAGLREREALAEVVATIEQAFDKAPYPTDKLMYAPGIFAAPEWEEVCNAFKGKFWQDLNVEFLLEHYDALFVFTADAYQYFLPAFLVAITKYYDQADYLVDTVIFIFLPPEPLVRWHKINPFAVLANQAANKCYRQRWEILSTHQRKAVSKCLFFLADYKDEYDAMDAVNALDEKWVRTAL